MTKKIMFILLILSTFFILVLLVKNAKIVENTSNTVIGELPEEKIDINDKEYEVYRKESEDLLYYDIVDINKKMAYTWIFHKSNQITSKYIEEKIDLRLDLNSTDKRMVISFSNDKELPENTKIEIDVLDNFNNKDNLYLYKYDEKENNLEFITDDIIVNNHKALINIDNCSKYILTNNIINEAINNPKNINYIIILLIVIALLLLIFTINLSKK